MASWKIAFSSFAGISRSEIELKKFTVFAGENNTGKSYVSRLLWHILRQGFLAWGSMKENPVYETFGDNYLKSVYDKMMGRVEKFELDPELLSRIMTHYYTHGIEQSFNHNQFLTENKPNDFSISFEPLKKPIVFIFDKIKEHTGQFAFKRKSKYEFFYNLEELKEDRRMGEFTFVIVFGTVLNHVLKEYFGFGSSNLEFLPPSRSAYMNLSKLISDYSLDSTYGSNRDYLMSPTNKQKNEYSLDSTLVEFFKNIISPIDIKTNKSILDLISEYEKKILNGSIVYDQKKKVYFYHSGRRKFPIRNASSLVSEFSPIFLVSQRFTRKSKNMLIIDEPESHLHPEKQFLSIEFLTAFYKLNNNVLITTHSDYIIHAINNNIKRYLVDSKDQFGIKLEDVVCYTFKREGVETNVEANYPGKYGLNVDTFNSFIRKIRDTTYNLDKQISEKG